MITNPTFFTVIIGSELLNGTREDAHFTFVNKQLLKRGYKQKGSFIIKDDVVLMNRVFTLIKESENSVMFCFGGIGSTPDDYTRQIAADVFTKSPLITNNNALNLIKEQFGKDAYPHRVKMANLPKKSKLLKNVINRVPGFYLDDRYFFCPGFPNMAHPMVEHVLDKFYNTNKKKSYMAIFNVSTTEDSLIDTMRSFPKEIELASLPGSIKSVNGKESSVEIHLSCLDIKTLKRWANFFEDELKNKNINFSSRKFYE